MVASCQQDAFFTKSSHGGPRCALGLRPEETEGPIGREGTQIKVSTTNREEGICASKDIDLRKITSSLHTYSPLGPIQPVAVPSV